MAAKLFPSLAYSLTYVILTMYVYSIHCINDCYGMSNNGITCIFSSDSVSAYSVSDSFSDSDDIGFSVTYPYRVFIYFTNYILCIIDSLINISLRRMCSLLIYVLCLLTLY